MLKRDNHDNYLKEVMNRRDLNYKLSEPCRLNTLYWIINSYKIMNIENDLKEEVLSLVQKCKNEDGGYGGSENYPSTILTTFNALQILYIYKQNFYDENTISFIIQNFKENGSFMNDKFGMSDNRINCSAVLSLHLLYLNRKMKFDADLLKIKISYEFCDQIKFNYKKCIEYIISCYNPDGGFGLDKGDESHCAFTFCCLSILRSLGSIEYVNKRDITRFIILRQDENGGLSGRVNKKEDVCYSFWAYAALKIINRNNFIDEEKLKNFILSCQAKEGGFSDRPGNEPDPYHLMFSLAGLSLLGYKGLKDIDPGFAL
ncbi:hypothetical protein P3W45_000277 [Vairimorpha bombi]|jgi:geranylgeranyl transferase type-2 subunit beta